jgi:hypothetical protein
MTLSPYRNERAERLVAGNMVETSIHDFINRCCVHIEAEQEKQFPDNALIATLCDAVRLTREFERQLKARFR